MIIFRMKGQISKYIMDLRRTGMYKQSFENLTSEVPVKVTIDDNYVSFKLQNTTHYIQGNDQ